MDGLLGLNSLNNGSLFGRFFLSMGVDLPEMRKKIVKMGSFQLKIHHKMDTKASFGN